MQLLYWSRKKSITFYYIWKTLNTVIQKRRWKYELRMFHTNFRLRLCTYMLPAIMCKIFRVNKKWSKIGQNHRTLSFAFTFFLLLLPIFQLQLIWDFPKISEFSKLFSLKSLSSSLGNSYIKFLFVHMSLLLICYNASLC